MTQVRSRSTFLFVALVLATGLLFVTPGPAHAEPASLAETTLQVQVWPEGEAGTSIVIVGVTLPAETQLPATVRMPLPEGAQVFWAGEIVDDTLANDIERSYEIVQAEGGQAVEFSVEETYTVQYEATYGSIAEGSGSVEVLLNWVQSVEAKDVSFAVRLPAGVQEVVIEPEAAGPPQTNAAGESLYALMTRQIPTGESSVLSVRYSYTSDAGATPGTNTLLIVLGVLLVIAVVVLFVAIAKQNATQTPPTDPDDRRTGDDEAAATEPRTARGSAPGNRGSSEKFETPDEDESFMTWD